MVVRREAKRLGGRQRVSVGRRPPPPILKCSPSGTYRSNVSPMNITCESLQTGRKLCKLIVPKIAVADPCRDHQNVVRVRNILMVLATSVDELGVFLDCII